MHEFVELVKALAWPSVVSWIVIMFRTEIRSLLKEAPGVVRRMRSAQGLGVEIELDKIGEELPSAELQAQTISLPIKPPPTKMDGSSLDANS
jgi:hypothetical protein